MQTPDIAVSHLLIVAADASCKLSAALLRSDSEDCRSAKCLPLNGISPPAMQAYRAPTGHIQHQLRATKDIPLEKERSDKGTKAKDIISCGNVTKSVPARTPTMPLPESPFCWQFAPLCLIRSGSTLSTRFSWPQGWNAPQCLLMSSMVPRSASRKHVNWAPRSMELCRITPKSWGRNNQGLAGFPIPSQFPSSRAFTRQRFQKNGH